MPEVQYEKGHQVGEWTIDRFLGEGSFGKVYRCYRQRMNSREQAAIKILKDPEELPHARYPDIWHRLEREARLLNSLKHPGFPRIIDQQLTRAPCFIVQELIDGVTLSRRLEQSPLDPRETLDLARQLLSALAVLYEHRISNRDIKPENMMIGQGGVLKVLDFGVSRGPGESQYDVGATPEYAPPREERRAISRDDWEGGARWDVYSAGRVLRDLIRRTQGGAPWINALWALSDEMTSEDPRARPRAAEALARLEGFAPAGERVPSGGGYSPGGEQYKPGPGGDEYRPQGSRPGSGERRGSGGGSRTPSIHPAPPRPLSSLPPDPAPSPEPSPAPVVKARGGALKALLSLAILVVVSVAVWKLAPGDQETPPAPAPPAPVSPTPAPEPSGTPPVVEVPTPGPGPVSPGPVVNPPHPPGGEVEPDPPPPQPPPAPPGPTIKTVVSTLGENWAKGSKDPWAGVKDEERAALYEVFRQERAELKPSCEQAALLAWGFSTDELSLSISGKCASCVQKESTIPADGGSSCRDSEQLLDFADPGGSNEVVKKCVPSYLRACYNLG